MTEENYAINIQQGALEQSVKDFIVTQLRAYNDIHSEVLRESRKPENDWQELAIIVRAEVAGADSATPKILGGLLGRTNSVWDWLDIEYFWLDASMRGKGLGQQIIREAEQEALRRGCHNSTVTTWSFQAPLFYQKMGYRIVGQLENHPPGATDYWLAKSLATKDSELITGEQQ
jgi:GNAT superfamily N-acetyltransferase